MNLGHLRKPKNKAKDPKSKAKGNQPLVKHENSNSANVDNRGLLSYKEIVTNKLSDSKNLNQKIITMLNRQMHNEDIMIFLPFLVQCILTQLVDKFQLSNVQV